MIKVENVSFKYKTSDYILKNISFSVQDGEIVAIVGKNGSGKSTIGRLIAGISQLKEGKIYIDDLEVSQYKDVRNIRDKTGIVFQNPENQIIFNNIHDELSFSLKNLEKEEKETRIEKALEQVEMLDYKNADLYSLSLGQKQRIMIAEILAKKPKYIVLDEPTTMIDSQGKEKIYEMINQLKKLGYTIICITNLADEILLADRTLILSEGKIITEISKEQLIERAEELKRFEIKIPTILEIAARLKKIGISLELRDFSVEELSSQIEKLLRKEEIE